MDLCLWTEKRQGRLYRCTSKGTVTMDVQGELVQFCPSHAAAVKRVQTRIAQYEKLLTVTKEEQVRVLDLINELRTHLANKENS